MRTRFSYDCFEQAPALISAGEMAALEAPPLMLPWLERRPSAESAEDSRIIVITAEPLQAA